MMLKRITTMMVKPACPAANETTDGAMPATATASGKSAQSATECDPMPTSRAEPTTKPLWSRRRRGGGRSGAEGVRAQDGERPEHHPEPVLHGSDLDDRHRERERERPRTALRSETAAEGQIGGDPVPELRRRPVGRIDCPQPGDRFLTGRLERRIGHHRGRDRRAWAWNSGSSSDRRSSSLPRPATAAGARSA